MEAQRSLPYLFVRGLRQADHTVFVVQNGQKTYWDPQFQTRVAYSSGQQVKRSILDQMAELMNEPRAPITFNHKLETNKKGEPVLTDGEPWSPCDPRHADQLVGGWMRARAGGGDTIKRRSPLSISAMRPLHPLLSTTNRETATFDRSEHPERHPVRVVDADGNEVSDEDLSAFLRENNRTLPRRKWIPEDQVGPRAHGLFVYDVAIDLHRLFRVSVNEHDPELDRDMIGTLKENGWTTSKDGEDLIAPKEQRDTIIPALAHALVHWRITSNQSRTFSPQPTLAVALSDNASLIASAIRADLDDEQPSRIAHPVVDDFDGVDVYVLPSAKGYVPGVINAAPDALVRAEQAVVEHLSTYDYEG